MNYEQNLVAIDRENITWKQNHYSCGSRMIQSEPECLRTMAAARRHPRHCGEVARRHPRADLRTARLTLASRLAHAMAARPWIYTEP